MPQTFSQTLTGTGGPAAQNVKIGDTDIAGNVIGNNLAAQQGVMRRNDYILCKGPDGALAYYMIDAERSTPGHVVLRKV